MKQNENTAWSLANALSVPMYHLECAVDLALCLSVAMEDGNVSDKQAGNALMALYNHLSDLYDEQAAILDTARTRTLEEEGQLQAQPEQAEAENT